MMRALVIDDSKAMRSIIGRIVRSLGFDVTEAGHGKEALQRLAESGVFDVALVDWNMPEMNGIEFVCAVRANPAYARMRLMIVTTESEIENVMKAMEAGADEYVMKPFTGDVIQEKLHLLGVIG